MLAAIITAFVLFGVWTTTHAAWVLAHGGNHAFGGAFDYPRWAALHFASALMFIVILPFQLWPQVRNRFRQAHRVAGRIAVGCGVVFASTALMLPVVMPARPFGERAFVVTVAIAFVVVVARGVAAARRHDVAAHRRWMLRVSAVGLGPLTQRLIFPVLAAAGIDSMARFWDLFTTALWLSAVLNIGLVEWWIVRTSREPIHAGLDHRRVSFGDEGAVATPGVTAR